MFEIAFLAGIFSYLILLLGFVGFLYAPLLIVLSIVFITGSSLFYRNNLKEFGVYLQNRMLKDTLRNDKIFILLLFLIIIQSLINFIGVLGPEIGFDALWYHLTLPKIYLSYHAIFHIPGGLFYYSDMPKLTEMLYITGLSFGSEIFPKLTHYLFGILTLSVIYKLSRKFVNPMFSIIAVIVLYSNLIVGWESISAYIDLARTFFESLALYGLFSWIETKDKKLFYEIAILLGLAISTKLLALGTFLIFIAIIFYLLHKSKDKDIFKKVFIFLFLSLIVPLPWFIFSYIHTGNLVYPFFTSLYPAGLSWQTINPIYLIQNLWELFAHAPDPISPVYLAVLPLIFWIWKDLHKNEKLVGVFCLLGLIFWYIIPHEGSGRFILPYLPAWSVFLVIVLQYQKKYIKNLLIGLIMISSLISIGYRSIANYKFIPVILGKESKIEFLTKSLNFSFGDFADTDSYFKTHTKSTDIVLLYGFHNLYYIDFPFIDSSYVQKGDRFNYIAVQNASLPKRFKDWQLVYVNPITHVGLYSFGGIAWTY